MQSTQAKSSALMRAFAVDSLNVRVLAGAQVLAQDAATLAGGHLRHTLQQQATAAVILATGQSQLLFLEAFLACANIDWNRVIFFHMDEYLGLPAEHPAGFRKYLHDRVETKVNAKAMHYLCGDTMEPLSECRRYTQLLQAQPIDLCFLGIGENGHLAFNDPAVANFNDPDLVKLVKLDDVCRLQQVKQGHFPNLNAVPPYAFTLTIPALCSARNLICLAQGTRKASIVKEALQGAIVTSCPASILRQQPHATLLLDPEAASQLP